MLATEVIGHNYLRLGHNYRQIPFGYDFAVGATSRSRGDESSPAGLSHRIMTNPQLF